LESLLIRLPLIRPFFRICPLPCYLWRKHTSDGGALVTQRGVVWDTVAGATADVQKTSDGTGSGSYVSHVTGLTPGETYYLRAYAINVADTSYGEERIFTTLDSVLVPR